MEKSVAVVVLLLMVLFGADQVRSSASDHRYKEGEAVPLYANKVGPFHNPRYFHFHFHFFFFFFFRAGSDLTSLSVFLTFWFSNFLLLCFPSPLLLLLLDLDLMDLSILELDLVELKRLDILFLSDNNNQIKCMMKLPIFDDMMI